MDYDAWKTGWYEDERPEPSEEFPPFELLDEIEIYEDEND